MGTQPELLSEGIGIGGEVPHEALISSNGHSVRYSKELGHLAKALADAQVEFKPLLKQAENPAYKRGNRVSKYADLPAVIDATRPFLAKNGLVVIQLPAIDHAAKTLKMTTKLLHSSGEWIENDLVLPAVMQGRFDVQSVGSAMTYARRYAWQSIVGVAAEDDDDGNAASGVGSQEAANAVAQEKIQKGTTVPHSLFWVWHDESQTAELIISQEIKKNVWPFVKQFWSEVAKACMVTGEQLEGLKYEMEQQGIPFSSLKGNDLTDKLKASIAAKTKKREPGEDAK